ncbi:MAG: thioredoxin domain-containing protein [Dehalococcoidia bacterium]|uniref:DsbA family protein n=1 Tax=Candidatus Amarobacter glycogenicus TaxID=3140699 RepID=UPI001DB37B84|nr:thioredoxin domain-containing protein [Dehalococcoidia bacterium]MBK7724608.1 thioredoxin domain-containing protein [Dehalococcoidia bacterium]MBK8561230.1 thioredoxin domain-containing protein [Dehalococcoidia bacterium]MBK9544281.1 thioredoxin domain-containing protein [Dehalococcoidia bacterium]MCC6266270.1 thioredoxin domain-containing protein [Dehalococcoidia bacterium]
MTEPKSLEDIVEPEPLQGATQTSGPVYVKDPPAWSYFLTPAALILGSIVIAATIWWTRDDSSGPGSTFDGAPAADAISSVPTASPAASAPAGLLDTMKNYARQTGLNEAAFSQCLGDSANVAELNGDLQEGKDLGVTGTPTFFVNNKMLVGAQPTAILEEIIQAELKGSPTTLEGYSAAVRELAAAGRFSIVAKKPDITGAAIEGNPGAKVVVAEYSDFQCPFCKQWTDTSLKAVRAKLGNDVALAFLHFPIVQIHPNAGNASLVAICAGKQGKFWPMHDLLFARQTEWAALK